MIRAFRPHPAVVHERFDDEIVVVNLESGSYYSLAGSAASIWDRLAAGVPDAVVAAGLAEGGEADRVATSVASFADECVRESLLVRADAAAETSTLPAITAAFEPPVLHKYSDMEDLLKIDPVHGVDEHGWPSTKRAEAA